MSARPAGTASSGTTADPVDFAERWTAAELTDILDQLPASITVLDPDGRIRYLNAKELRRIGRPAENHIGRTVEQVYGVDMLEYERERIQRALGGESVRFTWTQTDPDDVVAHYDCHLVRLPDDVFAAPALLLVTTDVSDQVTAQALDHDLRPHVLAVREQLAEHLEGALAAHIEALTHDLSLAARRLDTAAPSAARALHDAAHLTTAALDQLRGLLHDRIRLDSLDQFPAVVAWLSDEVQETLGFRPHLKVRGPFERMSVALAVDVIAVLAESLTNVARHAEATAAVVAISVTTGHVTVTVADNGHGGIRAGSGNGIGNLHARAARWGGACTWRPGAVGGTVLEWRAPLSKFPSELPDHDQTCHRAAESTPDVLGARPALRAAQLLFVLDTIPAASGAYDRDGRIVFANRTAVSWLACRHRDEVLGKRIRDLVPAHVEIPTRAYAQAALDGIPQQVERTNGDGRVHPKHVYSRYVPWFADGEVVGFLMQMHDITERMDTREEQRREARQDAAVQERRRVAEDLHDIVIQHLFAAGLRLDAEPAAHHLAPDANVEARAILLEVIARVDDSIADVRAAVAQLRCVPPTRVREETR